MNDRRPWRPEDGDTRCQECGAANIVWYTDSQTWNWVTGGDSPGSVSVLCVPCYVRTAEDKMAAEAFKLPAWYVTATPHEEQS